MIVVVYESKWFPWSSRINFIPFRIFRGPLFHKPVTGQELFFAVSYSKLTLDTYSTLNIVSSLNSSWNRKGFQKRLQKGVWTHCEEKTGHASASPARWDSPQPKVADAMRWIRRFSLFFCNFWMNQSHLDLVLVQVTKSAKRNQLFFAVLFFFQLKN